MLRREPVTGQPLTAHRWWLPLVSGVALWATLSGLGLLLTRTALAAPVVAWDTSFSRWLAAHREWPWTPLTDVGSKLADTVTAIAVTVVVSAILALRRRWADLLCLNGAILGELFVFLLVTATIQRARPPVPHLDPAPPTSSFPSGHTGAAVALYGVLAVLLLRGVTRRAVARPLAVLLWAIPVIVAVSRLYRGMHYLTDVVAGALGGGSWLVIALIWRAGVSQHSTETSERNDSTR